MRTRSTPSSSEIPATTRNEKNKEKDTTSSPKEENEDTFDEKREEVSETMSPDYSPVKSVTRDLNNNDSDAGTKKEDENANKNMIEALLNTKSPESISGNGVKDVEAKNDTGIDENVTENREGGDTDTEESINAEPTDLTVTPGRSTSEEFPDVDGKDDLRAKGKSDESSSEDKNPPSGFSFPGMIPPFPANPASFLAGQLQSEFAKSFYSSLSLLASQAMMNVKQEPRESGYHGHGGSRTNLTPSSGGKLQIPPRNDSRSSDASARSYDERYSRSQADSSHRSHSPALSGGSEIALHHPPSGLSPKSLAEQLRNNDSASMVVSRQQKFPGRNQGFGRQTPFTNSSGCPSPPPVFPTLDPRDVSPHSTDLPTVSAGNMTSTPSLHHFTTRYTVETPADPSRLGVELVLDHDNDEPVIEVECGGNRGLLYVNKLCQGSKGQSIHFKDEWLTPNEFQFISGRETAKDWKRSIRHCGKSLKTLMTKGILQVHPPVCECNQCRGLHAASKLLPGKKTPQKDNIIPTNRIKSSPPFTNASDTVIPVPDGMTRHGFEGSLNSIISQLRKANGFDSNDPPETLDLSTKSQDRNNGPSPSLNPRKRSRNDSPEPKKSNDEMENGKSSPSAKRLYARHDDYGHNQIDPASFAASYPFMQPEEHYRRVLALMSRSMSPGEQQRQLLNMAQNLADPLGIPHSGFSDFPALSNSLHRGAVYNDRSKGKYKPGRDGSEESSHPYDLSRKPVKNSSDALRRPGYGFPTPDKYRKPDRQSLTPSRGDQKYIALESRHRDENHPHRDDIRSWTSSKHSAMIDLNSSGSGRMPDWPKAPWSVDSKHNSRKHPDVKSSPSRNGPFNGYFQDNIVLDRIPISKTPVTTLHHRPSSNYSADNDRRRRQKPYSAERHRPAPRHDAPKRTPMLDLQKHAVPMLSLKRPSEDMFQTAPERKLGKRLSHGSDQEMKEIHDNRESSSIRQSSSAPPPHLSPQEANREARRPTSAQERLHPGMSQAASRSYLGSPVASRHLTSSSFGDVMEMSPCESYFQKRDSEIRRALEDMQKWTTEDVCNFIANIDDSVKAHIQEFRNHEIDGEGLPLLTERHLMDVMNIKLGRALKVVARVKRALKILPETLACCHHPLLSPNPHVQGNESLKKLSENDRKSTNVETKEEPVDEDKE